MKLFIVLLSLTFPLTLMGQDIVYLSSDSAKPILKEWQHHTYEGIKEKKVLEIQLVQSYSNLSASVNNLYNSPQYNFLKPMTMNPLDALQQQV